jgi:hypothetical protein
MTRELSRADQARARTMRARHPAQWNNRRLARYFGVPENVFARLFPVIPKATPAAIKRHGAETLGAERMEKQSQHDSALERLASDLDIAPTTVRENFNKWQAGQPAANEKARAIYSHLDAHPETFGARRQNSATLPTERTTRGADDFARNEPAGPQGQTR